jgi:hypothetical protein
MATLEDSKLLFYKGLNCRIWGGTYRHFFFALKKIQNLNIDPGSFFCGFAVVRGQSHGAEQRLHRRRRLQDHDRRGLARELRCLRLQQRPPAPAGPARAAKFANRFPRQSFAQLPPLEKAEQKLTSARFNILVVAVRCIFVIIIIFVLKENKLPMLKMLGRNFYSEKQECPAPT